MVIFVEFTSEENINGKRKYIIPWNQINLESKQPIKQFKLDFGKDFVCSDGKIVIFKKVKGGGFCFAPFNTGSFDSLTLTDPFDEQALFPRAISNDRKLAVSLVQQKTTKRVHYQSYGPNYVENPDHIAYKTKLKVFNNINETKVIS